MVRWLLNVNVSDGHVPVALWVITAAIVVVLLVRDDARRWTTTALPAIAAGVCAGAAAVWVCDATDVFGVPLPHGTGWWMALAGGGIGLGVASLRHTTVWRKVLAGALIVAAPLSAGMGINAGFGLTPTVADVFGVNTLAAVGRLPRVQRADAAPHIGVTPTPRDLYARWRPPADMPRKGRIGTLTGAQRIPSTGGFTPRDPTIYLPPAALVHHAPALPFVVMMNGKPGRPDPNFVAGALNRLAATHRGLAPIVIIADQLGAEDSQQPACSPYSVYGNVATYIDVDIPRYARTHLNIIHNPRYWTIAGYSDGGACALKWATQYPRVWGNMISISGDKFPGASEPVAALRDGFRGDVGLDEASRPAVFAARNRGRFAGHVAVFTGGALDARFSGYARENAEMLSRAGFTVTEHEIPGATHVGPALSDGLLFAFAEMYPPLGLAPTPGQ